jgi:hypothetical protein
MVTTTIYVIRTASAGMLGGKSADSQNAKADDVSNSSFGR